MSNLGIGSRVKHPAYGDGVVINVEKLAYEISFIQYGIKHVGRDYAAFEIIDAVETSEAVSFSDAEESLIKILRAWSDVSEEVELGDRWTDGVMILKPGDPTLKSKEIPIDTFFHKIVMVRDRIRVMEQRINSSKLTDEEKVSLQRYTEA